MSSGTELMQRLLATEVKAELLLLFHRNPGIIDTLDGVARRIGRTANTVEKDIRDLVDLGVLKIKQVGKSQVVYLDRARDQELQELVIKGVTGSQT